MEHFDEIFLYEILPTKLSVENKYYKRIYKNYFKNNYLEKNFVCKSYIIFLLKNNIINKSVIF